MKRWAYKLDSKISKPNDWKRPFDEVRGETVSWLNSLGEEGWELVHWSTAESGVFAVFKREES